ncbi:MAG: rRNA maturation RNase YbeY [Candidatus Niyogibacteria bacterium CG10_big_fil_rev_8_21_14_0_10_46_36]|uniref:rRNA maturation RNase YbeY n=1 Tax=Candidatus Niyogibacteria bacterium CG10_big_fil_rev_8_21_14_0_10_46_36 TaxID=1974726 RepID=A0A2H0TE22_9BACT|nr:MAG: rRNA maturation RNase YbeY [Candidatus Niyogibacteria bacterium CG10_big_fil_rev_8_21_14_0_10_46_36]
MAVELNSAAQRFRSVPWQDIQTKILGKRFQISVAILSDTEMRRVRRILRAQKKFHFEPNHALNVLSFLLGDGIGEVLLNKDQIRKEAERYGDSFRERLMCLYIHGLLHIKGYDHKHRKDEIRMTGQEEKFFGYFVKR